ncbi:3-isopropylmalate dehydratase small subunit [Buchnera aphidicola (Eriosoma lanigerum)]|uniref:3-isopropylmalate dehydratase small subunit n=1 Tax=Buchnera aphidicola TaxID=9 RepID=UPI003464DC02
MNKFKQHSGIIAPLNISNIDTDSIIPKQFLQHVTREGFGQYLFHDWRFLDSQRKKENYDFILNKEYYRNSSILLARNNFGCGSSREHAVWALMDYGFKVIIAVSFADIFYNNSFNNHLLLITLTEQEIDNIFSVVHENLGITCYVSLKYNKVIINNKEYFFSIPCFHRFCLLNGLDSIDLTMNNQDLIKNYEKNIPNFFIR